MKKSLVILFMSVAVAVSAQQTTKTYEFGEEIVSTTINNVISTLAPVGHIPGTILGFSVTFSSPVIDPVLQFGYIRDGLSTIIFSTSASLGSPATTFSWEPNLTGRWILIPGDQLFFTSSDPTPAQLTYTIDRNIK